MRGARHRVPAFAGTTRCSSHLRTQVPGAFALLLFALAALAQSPCEAPDAVLRPEAAPLDARAVWLDARTIRWPGAPVTDRFTLYRSADARIVARPGAPVAGADESIALEPTTRTVERFAYLASGATLSVARVDDALWRDQIVIAREDARGIVIDATRLQVAGALDDRFAARAAPVELGAGPRRFALWAPTARAVSLCIYPDDRADAESMRPLARAKGNGVWTLATSDDLSGRYFAYVIEVYAPGAGVVRRRVVDPYAVGLGVDAKRGYVAELAAPALNPRHEKPFREPLAAPTDLVVYELHVRDFSARDATVPPAHRGKYLAFTDFESAGMHHLRELARAGVTDVHLLPVFDFATVNESACDPQGDAAHDCYNWGYDPQTFGAPEGSYATDASNGATRIVEFRRMVNALHAAGLRVGMDVVYNHTSDQLPLDRIVPGYYHRLDASGRIERSTCCANTATENAMMERLMIDTAVRWARDYGVDSFRFDLMGHQPRAAMERLQQRVDAAAGRHIALIGEGWNFGEVANGARFVQASQLSLGGSGIGTFSDRARDALRGGGATDTSSRGYLNGARDAHLADLVRLGLAGTLTGFDALARLDYNGQPAAYASAPDEVVNYVENHDNLTLFDSDTIKMPGATRAERARVQILGAAAIAFSQGIAYFHAGQDLLRSKNLDANSYDSGDAVNAIDWSAADPDVAWTRDRFRELLRVRASSTLFRLRTAADVRERLTFVGTDPLLVAARIDGAGYGGAAFAEIVYFLNADSRPRELVIDALRGKAFAPHPALRENGAAFDPATARFSIPARSAAVFVR